MVDPYLTGEYAEWYTKGMQQAPEDPYHIQASACCKHYVANSMDGTTEKDGEHHDRNHVDSIVPMQDLIDSYMLPFQSCVEKGQVTSLMCRCVNSDILLLSKACSSDLVAVTVTTQSMVCHRVPTIGSLTQSQEKNGALRAISQATVTLTTMLWPHITI